MVEVRKFGNWLGCLFMIYGLVFVLTIAQGVAGLMYWFMGGKRDDGGDTMY